MALAAILEKLDGLSADVSKEYVQKDGKFFLNVTPVGTFALEDVGGLKTALSSERTARETLEKSVKAFEGLDADAARKALAKLEEIKNWKPDDKTKEIIESQVKQVQEKAATEVKGHVETNGKLTKALNDALISSAATLAIAKLKGIPELLMPHVSSRTRMAEKNGKFVAEVLDDKGNVRISPKSNSTEPMTVEELVEEMRKSDIFSRAFDGEGASGSGSGGTGGRGSGTEIRLSVTDQKNPALYRSAKERATKEGKTLVLEQ